MPAVSALPPNSISARTRRSRAIVPDSWRRHLPAQVNEPSAAAAQLASARALRRRLRGDLDNIALKAMANEPKHRYASAGALADDVERLIDGQSVTAHPRSSLYRAREFIGRHRDGVATTALLVLAALASLAIAVAQARSARQDALRANIVRDFVVGLFDTASAHLPRDQRPTPEALVEQAQHKFDQCLVARCRNES